MEGILFLLHFIAYRNYAFDPWNKEVLFFILINFNPL